LEVMLAATTEGDDGGLALFLRLFRHAGGYAGSAPPPVEVRDREIFRENPGIDRQVANA
jgi:hypothetical protein